MPDTITSIKPSEAETRILRVLWAHSPCSVKTIHKLLSTEKSVGYTTTLKQIQRMEDKSMVVREPGEGKSYNYRATVNEAAIKSSLVNRFVKTTFGNSVSGLVMHALGNANPTEAELAEIKKFITSLETNKE